METRYENRELKQEIEWRVEDPPPSCRGMAERYITDGLESRCEPSEIEIFDPTLSRP
jgi:hypothetical protein